jgi:streptogrisin C
MAFAQALILCFITSGTAVANGEPGTADTSAGVAAYAAATGVSHDIARTRLELHASAGSLDERLLATQSRTYAGLWIQHAPDFRIIVQYTESDPDLSQYAGELGLGELTDMRLVSRSLADLEEDLLIASPIAGALMMDVMIDVMANQLVARVSSATDLERLNAAKFPPSTLVDRRVHVSRLTANMFAGLGVSGCTSGFTVRHTLSGVTQYGVTTAGHCSDTQSYLGVNLPYKEGKLTGSHDEQWHLAPGFTIKNWMKAGNPVVNRSVTSKKYRSGQPINGWTCKYGVTTGERCEYLYTKTYQPPSDYGCSLGQCMPNPKPTFMLVKPQGGPDMADGGDSGGPVYRDYTAYGIVSGETGLPWCVCDLIFTAIDYVESGLGVAVLTSTP